MTSSASSAGATRAGAPALIGLGLVVGLLAGCSPGGTTTSAASPGRTPATAPALASVPPSVVVSGGASAGPGPRPAGLPTVRAATPFDPLASRPPLESPPRPGLPTCSASGLSVTDADAVYTSDAVQELFTIRTSGPDCQLAADYPAVIVLTATGERPGTVHQGGFGLATAGATPLTISRSTSLSFFLASRRDGSCVPAASVSVTLAGTASGLVAATALQVCDGALGVGPLQRLGDTG